MTAHAAQKSLLITAFQHSDVAAEAGVAALTWVDRILVGDRAGYIHSLHRGRLPAVELMQENDDWPQATFAGDGMVTSRWRVRVHVGGFSAEAAETTARRILYAGLVRLRSNNYFKIGSDAVSTFNPSALGHTLEAVLTVTNAMSRETYEMAPSPASVPDTAEDDVGGIAVTVNYNSTSPVAVLSLPAGQSLNGIQMHVQTPFDGVGAQITVGIGGDQSRYMAAADSDLTIDDSVWEKDIEDEGPQTVNVYVTPGSGATQGSVRIQISVTNA